jgi:MinD superfamily P-loop ATPase
MIISVASGKGGTGKTLVATSLALSLKDTDGVQLLDCDVEEPDAHLFLKPEIAGSQAVSVAVPRVNDTRCNYCGQCAKVCAYHAIAVLGSQVVTFPELCHGCGACSYLCPKKAISEESRGTGVIEWGQSDGVGFVQGKLNVGEAMASPVIRKVKELAGKDGTVIVDVPPGISCPVVEAVKGSDFCLLVTEPTPFGLNDLALAVEMTKKLDIPCGVILNRSGAGDSGVADYCKKEGIPVLLAIPLDIEIARFYSIGITLAEGLPQWQDKFLGVYQMIKETLDERNRGTQR